MIEIKQWEDFNKRGASTPLCTILLLMMKSLCNSISKAEETLSVPKTWHILHLRDDLSLRWKSLGFKAKWSGQERALVRLVHVRWFSCARRVGSSCGHMAESPILIVCILRAQPHTFQWPPSPKLYQGLSFIFRALVQWRNPFTVAIPQGRPLTYATGPQKFRPQAIETRSQNFRLQPDNLKLKLSLSHCSSVHASRT